MENAAAGGEFQGGVEIASRGERLSAYVLDVVITLPFLLPTFVLVYRFFRIEAAHEAIPGTLVFAAALCAVSMVAFSLYQLYLVAVKGQSLGKRWMRIKIVGPEGNAPGFVRGVLLRRGIIVGINLFLLMFFGRPFGQTLGQLFVLVDVLAIFGTATRCLHDRIAETRVVRVAPASPAAVV